MDNNGGDSSLVTRYTHTVVMRWHIHLFYVYKWLVLRHNPHAIVTWFIHFLNSNKFILKFSTLAAPLNNLLKKDPTFEWMDETQWSFDELVKFWIKHGKMSDRTTRKIVSVTNRTSASTYVLCHPTLLLSLFQKYRLEISSSIEEEIQETMTREDWETDRTSASAYVLCHLTLLLCLFQKYRLECWAGCLVY